MSTHTDGAASPSVGAPDDDAGSDGAADTSAVFGPDAVPPRPRDPSAAGPEADGAPGPAPPPGPPGRSSSRRNGNRNGTGDGNGGPESDWLQQEIQRRIAERGTGEPGRHSRRARPDPGDDAAGPSDAPADETPPPRPVGERHATPRPRSTSVPDPYAPGGMREQGDGPPFAPEGPFRMAGPAAAAPESRGPVPPPAGAEAPPGVAPKQWPPAEGAAGLPRRVPGAGWTLDRRWLGDGADGTAPPAAGDTTGSDAEPETRIVPALWAAAPNGPPTTDLGTGAGTPAPGHTDDLDDEDDLDDDLDDYDDEDDFATTGLATGDTEVIWRAPGLDEPPVPPPPTTDGAISPNPYTGVRPRRFAGAPIDAEPEPDVAEEPPDGADADDGPQSRRKRVVLSERRSVAHSVRTVVDVQDPGPVGSMLRSQLVSTQLRIAMQVGGVAVFGLAVLPALFAAFPAIGEVSVLGIRLPWLVLGFLTYPFLLALGWWYVGSAERVEQEFAQEVQDR